MHKRVVKLEPGHSCFWDIVVHLGKFNLEAMLRSGSNFLNATRVMRSTKELNRFHRDGRLKASIDVEDARRPSRNNDFSEEKIALQPNAEPKEPGGAHTVQRNFHGTLCGRLRGI